MSLAAYGDFSIQGTQTAIHAHAQEVTSLKSGV